MTPEQKKAEELIADSVSIIENRIVIPASSERIAIELSIKHCKGVIEELDLIIALDDVSNVSTLGTRRSEKQLKHYQKVKSILEEKLYIKYKNYGAANINKSKPITRRSKSITNRNSTYSKGP